MRLPTYERQVGVAGQSGGVRGSVEAASAGAAALSAAADRATSALGAYGERIALQARQQEEKAAAVEAAKVYAQAGSDWTGYLLEAEQQAPEGAPDYTKGIVERFDADAAQRLAAAPEHARPWLETQLADLRAHVTEKAMVFEAGARVAKQGRDLQGVIDLHANAVRTDWDRVTDAMAAAEGAIEASSLAPAAKTQAREQAREAIAFSAVNGLNERDPEYAKTLLEDGRFDHLLSASAKDKLVNNNFVELRRRQAEAEQRAHLAKLDLRDQLRDVEARLIDGRPADYDERRIRAVLGEKEGGQVVAALGSAAALGRDRVAIGYATPEELAGIIEERRADVEGPDVEGYAGRAKALEILQGQITERNRRIAQDPAAYVMAAPPVREAWEGLAAAQPDEAPTATDRFVRAVLGEQQRLGVPETARRVLTEPQAKELVARVSRQGGEEGSGGGTLVIELADQYGRHWPRVMAELQDAGLPEIASLIGAMDRREQRPAAIRLAEASRTGAKALKEAVGTDIVRDIDRQIPDALQDFEETVRHAPGAGGIISTYREGVRLLAMDYVLEGASATEAVRRVAAEIVTDHYEFRDGWRVPKEFNVDQIEDAAAVVLQELDAVVPPAAENRRLEADQVAAAYLRQVKARGRWVTNEDETGLILLDEKGYVVMRRSDPEPEPVQVLFREAYLVASPYEREVPSP